MCLFSTRAATCDLYSPLHRRLIGWEALVKKVALALALVVASLSLGGCFVGKGKAPTPVISPRG